MVFSHAFHRIAAAALLILTGVPLWAAESLSLPQALRIAAARSQQLVAQDASTAAAREMAVSGGQLPDPVLKVGVDNLPVNGPDALSLTNDFMTMRRIGFAQELPRANKRQARTDRLEQEVQVTQAQSQMALANLQRDAAMAWLDRYYSERMRDLLNQQIQESRLQVEAADIAFGTARGSQADVFAARAAVLSLEDRISQIDRQGRSAGLALRRWLGQGAERPLQGDPPWRDSRQAGQLTAEQLRSHPQIATLSAQLAAAEAELRLADANKRSDWTVEASYSQRGPAYSNMVSVGLSIPLQWDPKNRQDREVAAKAAKVAEARATYEDMLRAHAAEVQALQNDWENGKERMDRYSRQILPTASQRTTAALTAYRAGKGDLTGALAARRDEIDQRMQALTLEMETARLWAQLNFLTPDTTLDNPLDTTIEAQPLEQP